MPAVLEQVARTCSPELFLLTVIAICFGTAFLTNLAGVSLSLGAFLAGLVVSESRFSQHALGEILPLQILFSAIFFVSVGHAARPRLPGDAPAAGRGGHRRRAAGEGAHHRSERAGACASGPPVAVATALMLAQVGEFSFVLERAGRADGPDPGGLGARRLAGVHRDDGRADGADAVPHGARAARRRAARRSPPIAGGGRRSSSRCREGPRRENHVVVAGYGQAARRLVRVLRRLAHPVRHHDAEPGRCDRGGGRRASRCCAATPAASTRCCSPATDRAKVLVVPDDDPAMAHRVASVARLTNPTMRIVVRTRYIAEMEPLLGVGVDRVIAEELESVVQLFADVMRSYDLPAEEIERHEEAVRRGGYAALRVRGTAGDAGGRVRRWVRIAWRAAR